MKRVQVDQFIKPRTSARTSQQSTNSGSGCMPQYIIMNCLNSFVSAVTLDSSGRRGNPGMALVKTIPKAKRAFPRLASQLSASRWTTSI
jgi:hypothetical protein